MNNFKKPDSYKSISSSQSKTNSKKKSWLNSLISIFYIN